ncbi:MAG: hypothetical protein QM765_40340 [Myxococcales bacterium]
MSVRPYWIVGIALAVAGICLARLWAPHVESGRIPWTLAGHGVALAGIFTIAFGTRRKYAAAALAAATETGPGEGNDTASP